jgi:hypothetical protein
MVQQDSTYVQAKTSLANTLCIIVTAGAMSFGCWGSTLLLLFVVLLWSVVMIVYGSSQLRGKRTCPLGVSIYFVRQDDACRLISEGQAPLAGSREKDEDSIASQSPGELIR